MISKNSLIKSKKFYEIVSLCCALAGIIDWAAGIVFLEVMEDNLIYFSVIQKIFLQI